MGTAKPDSRMRIFATIIYPESAPENFRELISQTHVQALLSPLHDRDRFIRDDGSEGEIKKPHYHLLMYFSGKQSKENVLEMVERFGGVGLEIVKSKSGYSRYLCHLDNPEKPQYSPTDVRAFSGANFIKWSELESDPMLFVADIQDFIERHDVISFYQLCKYCRQYKPEWYKVLATRSTIYFERYIKSRAWEGSYRNDSDELIMRWKDAEVQDGYLEEM